MKILKQNCLGTMQCLPIFLLYCCLNSINQILLLKFFNVSQTMLNKHCKIKMILHKYFIVHHRTLCGLVLIYLRKHGVLLLTKLGYIWGLSDFESISLNLTLITCPVANQWRQQSIDIDHLDLYLRISFKLNSLSSTQTILVSLIWAGAEDV